MLCAFRLEMHGEEEKEGNSVLILMTRNIQNAVHHASRDVTQQTLIKKQIDLSRYIILRSVSLAALCVEILLNSH